MLWVEQERVDYYAGSSAWIGPEIDEERRHGTRHRFLCVDLSFGLDATSLLLD